MVVGNSPAGSRQPLVQQIKVQRIPGRDRHIDDPRQREGVGIQRTPDPRLEQQQHIRLGQDRCIDDPGIGL